MFREKTQLPAPDPIPEPGFFSVLRRARRELSATHRVPERKNPPSLSRDFDNPDCVPELHGLLDALRSIRLHIVTNRFLEDWIAWSAWILIALIAVLAVSARLAIAMILAAILAAVGATLILVWDWRLRPSTYQTARQVDSAAGLRDRVSTAVYLGDARNPAGLIERQRQDALARTAKVDLRKLFPLRAPLFFRRALAILLAAAALCTYRIHHRPPLLALWQTTARSPLVQSIISPLVQAMEKDLQRTMALVTSKPDALSDQLRAGEAAPSSDDLWQSSDEKSGGEKLEDQESLEAGDADAPQDQMQPAGDQNGSPNAQSQQQENDSPQSPGGANSGQNSANNSQQPSGAQGSQNSRESLSQSLMQALKNMMSNSPNQQSNSRSDQQSRQPNSQGASQSGNSHQPGNTDSDKKGDSHGSSDAKQKATESASNGAGSQAGSKEMNKELAARPVTAVPDRVALESSGFKEQTRMRIDTETGSAQMAVRGGSSQGEAVINGAEQENIPPRYRLYVQQYFERVDNAKQ